MAHFFVAGTDTGVGKTLVAKAMIQTLQKENATVVGYKPIACGESVAMEVGNEIVWVNPDIKMLFDTITQPITPQEINTYMFKHIHAPLLGDSEEFQQVDLSKIKHDFKRLKQRFQHVVVEGTHGWLTPMNTDTTFAQWVKKEKLPVVLVVGIKEGCINHAMLTAMAMEKTKVPIIGWIANSINPGLGHYKHIIDYLAPRISAPLIGQIPYIFRPTEQDLSQFIEIGLLHKQLNLLCSNQ